MTTLLQIVHGYPPAEVAGTEIYAQRVTAGMTRRGWRVHVIAATRAPGRRQGEVIEAPLPGGGRLLRRVNNLPWRPLAALEADADAEAWIHSAAATLAPDLVHVQHLLFLSARLRFQAPTLGTFHDAWAVCPRAGSLLRRGEAACPGPPPRPRSPETHRRPPTRTARPATPSGQRGARSSTPWGGWRAWPRP